jgi:hypothetical protein
MRRLVKNDKYNAVVAGFVAAFAMKLDVKERR